jgi:hypothetical protein
MYLSSRLSRNHKISNHIRSIIMFKRLAYRKLQQHPWAHLPRFPLVTKPHTRVRKHESRLLKRLPQLPPVALTALERSHGIPPSVVHHYLHLVDRKMSYRDQHHRIRVGLVHTQWSVKNPFSSWGLDITQTEALVLPVWLGQAYWALLAYHFPTKHCVSYQPSVLPPIQLSLWDNIQQAINRTLVQEWDEIWQLKDQNTNQILFKKKGDSTKRPSLSWTQEELITTSRAAVFRAADSGVLVCWAAHALCMNQLSELERLQATHIIRVRTQIAMDFLYFNQLLSRPVKLSVPTSG